MKADCHLRLGMGPRQQPFALKYQLVALLGRHQHGVYIFYIVLDPDLLQDIPSHARQILDLLLKVEMLLLQHASVRQGHHREQYLSLNTQ